MKYLSYLVLLFIGCSTSANDNNIPNPFESEYVLDEVKSDLNGTSSFSSLNKDFYFFTIETSCEDASTCPTVDIFIMHNFDENLVFTKNFGSSPTSISDVLLYPEGKCAIPFSPDSGTLQVNRLEDGNFNGTFDVKSREVNGYSPDSRLGCAENQYSGQGIKTISFEGTFTSSEIVDTVNPN